MGKGRKTVDPDTGLTPQQEAFAMVLAQTGNASEAHRQAYPAQKLSPESLAVKACRLAGSDKIKSRLSQLRSHLRDQSILTLEDHMKTLAELRDAAKGDKQFGAAITAETNRGKVAGHYVEKTEVSGKNGGPVEVVNLIIQGVKPNG